MSNGLDGLFGFLIGSIHFDEGCPIPTPLRRQPVRRSTPKKWPLNLHTLQMMLQSGVVRRADCNPPGVNNARFHMVDDVDRDSTNDTVTEEG
jgi:hypothetical protein